MTALLYLLGVLVFAVGVAVSIGLHEVGHMLPGEEVRREGHAVLRRLRPHRLVDPARRDGVRPQGGPARRLRQARRACSRPPGTTTRAASAGEQHRDVHPADLRRPRGGVRARRARRRGPAVLPAAVVEEGHRDGRRPDGEPGHRLRASSPASSGSTASTSRRPRSAWSRECVVPAEEEGRACTAADPRLAGGRGRPAARATRSSAFNGTEIGDWERAGRG